MLLTYGIRKLKINHKLTMVGSPRLCGCSTPSAMRNLWLKERLDELRHLGKTQRGLAAALNVAESRVSEMIKGTRIIAAREVPIIAQYLMLPEGTVLAHLSGGAVQPVDVEQIDVVGAVQAGVWRPALEWDRADWYRAPVAADRRFKGLHQFGLEIRGSSMNRIYPPGSIVICVGFLDLGRDPKPGERVVVQRRSDDGFEATVKELQQTEDGSYWLWPKSDDPNFQQPWQLPLPDEHDQNEDIRIVALVVGSYRPES